MRTVDLAIAGALGAALAMGCALDEADVEVGERDSALLTGSFSSGDYGFGGTLGYRDRQGRSVLGGVGAPLASWTVHPYGGVTDWAIEQGRLRVQVGGTFGDPAGAVYLYRPGAAGGWAWTMVTSVDDSGDVPLYEVWHWQDGGPWQPLCGGARAFATPGKWWPGAWYDSQPDEISFACASGELVGTAGKCIRWGFAPWQSTLPPHMRDALHGICVRAARADYLYEDVPRTLDGTEIVLGNDHGVTPYGIPALDAPPTGTPAGTSPLYFEAAWGWQGVICLSKARWQTMPINGLGQQLRDPRWVNNNSKFCEDYGDPAAGVSVHDGLVNAGAILFNDSYLNDVGLHQWASGGGALQATTEGFFAEDAAHAEVPPGFPIYRGFEGGLLVRPRAGQTRPLSLWRRDDGVLYTGIKPPPPTSRWVREQRLGHVFKTPPVEGPNVRELISWRNPATDRFVTTVHAPPAGYTQQVAKHGWVLWRW